MKKRIVLSLGLVIGLTAILTLLTAHVPQSHAADSAPLMVSTAEGEDTVEYSYFYKGRLVTLNLSLQLIAVKQNKALGVDSLQNLNLAHSPLSDQQALKQHGYILYHLQSPQNEIQSHSNFKAQMSAIRTAIDGEVQPVFEQGPALLIPSDELIVGFKEDTTFDQAWEFFELYLEAHGILSIRGSRKNTYILKIDNPSNGRVYPLSQIFSRLDAISFAEPNHIIVRLPRPQPPIPQTEDFSGKPILKEKGPVPEKKKLEDVSIQAAANPVGWTTLLSEGFESASPLPDKWETGIFSGRIDAKWSVFTVTDEDDKRAHSGSRSCYATGGGSDRNDPGKKPPELYPHNAKSWLFTPELDLATYENGEVYVELWFYAKYQNPKDNGPDKLPTFYDFGRLGIYNLSTDIITYFKGFPELVIFNSGDLTADPTTENGWRRALLRVPKKLRLDNVKIAFVFTSDGSIAQEGLYIDDVRVVGTTNVDTTSLGSDTYGARQYELKNAGQIAGLGNDSNDMEVPEAWDLAKSSGFDPVSADILVAVIDDGVDQTHRDLNQKPGYDSNGKPGGHPRGSHGTQVAGNIGAIRNNGRGVIGTAPNAKILSIYYGTKIEHDADAIDLAVAKGAHVLNISWGRAPFTIIENAIKDALAADRTVLIAAGNGPDRPPWTYDTAFPCNLTGDLDVICVGATSPTDEHKGAASSDGLFGWGSSYLGDGPDVCAPGPWSYTTDIQGKEGDNAGSDDIHADYHHDFGGTSSSTPKVAGIAALMLSIDPALIPSEVKRILRATAKDIDIKDVDDKTGAGRVNALEAVKYVLNKPRATTGSVKSAGPSSNTITLTGTVNPKGSHTECYFQYGISKDYGRKTFTTDVGSGSADVAVTKNITITDTNAQYHYRLVANNGSQMAYGKDKTFGSDTDADAMPDWWEQDHFRDLTRDGKGDEDADGLSDLQEYENSTDPNDSDTDGDGLTDGDEVNTHGTDPNDKDTDRDGVSDKDEIDNGRHPTNREPGKPELYLPPNDVPTNPQQDVSLTAQLETKPFWDADDNDHDLTRWQIAIGACSAGSFNNPDDIVYDATNDTQLTLFNVPDLILDVGTDYCWRVRFTDTGNATSDWSDPFSFSTVAQSDDDQNPQNGIPDDQEADCLGIFDPGQIPANTKCVDALVGNAQVGVEASANVVSIDAFKSVDPRDIPQKLSNVDLLIGLMSFKAEVDQVGDIMEVTYHSSVPMPIGAECFLYNPVNGWQNYHEHVVAISADRKSITIEYKDGGFGDLDGVANKFVVDPVGFGVSGPGEIFPSSNTCFISTIVSGFSRSTEILALVLFFSALLISLSSFRKKIRK